MQTALAKYHAANLPELMERINRNSIGMDDYLDRFFNLHETTQNYPPYNLVHLSETLSRLEMLLRDLKRKKSKSTHKLESYLWKARKKIKKQMQNLSIKDWPNVPLPDNGRSPTIQRYDRSALKTDSWRWN